MCWIRSWASLCLGTCLLLLSGGALAESPERIQDIPGSGPVGQIHATYADPSRTLTIDPAGTGETLAAVGITLRVHVTHSLLGTPVAGVPAGDIVLFSHQLCYCALMQAAGPTDANGDTEFTGTLRGGGCAEELWLFVDGVFCEAVSIRINSPDTGIASACAVDASDLIHLARRLGKQDQYDFCFDYNDSGGIDASDLAFFASKLGSDCSAP